MLDAYFPVQYGFEDFDNFVDGCLDSCSNLEASASALFHQLLDGFRNVKDVDVISDLCSVA